MIFVIPTIAYSEIDNKEERKKLASEYLKQGVISYQNEKYEEAAQYYIASVQQWSSVRAIGNLCNLYLYGQGVEQNYSQALKLCKAAAKYDDPHSLVMLGEMYLFGKGVKIDKEIAKEYYRKGADLEHTHGQYILGRILLEETPNEARRYLEKAALKGHSGAKELLTEINNKANK